MRKFYWVIVMIVAALIVDQPMLAMAQSTRIIPTETVSTLSDCKVSNQFKSEMAVPDGTLMVSKGKSLVQKRDLQLIVQDKTVFSISEESGKSTLTVKSGRVDFSFRADSKQVAFQTPNRLIDTASKSMTGMVKGHLIVTAERAELAVTEGALQVAGKNGPELIEAGHPLALAGAVWTCDAGVSSGTKSDSDNKEAGLFGLGTAGTALLAVGVAGAGVAAGIAASQSSSSSPTSVQ